MMQSPNDPSLWLPTTAKEVGERGWTELDVILFTGDAYVDHPSFGASVIGRIIEAHGLKVAIVPQPNWRDDLRDFKKLGAPRLFFGVTGGNMDSMVNHYTANRRRRSDDAYTPGGKAGFRPDYASVVYTKILKQLFPDVPVVLGGIEGSLRRVTHYDYWSDMLKPGILAESGADLLVYGMGEQPLESILSLLKKGVPFSSLTTIPQTAIMQPASLELPKNKNWNTIELHSHQECLDDKLCYAKNFKHVEQESNRIEASRLTQVVGDNRIIINPPFPPMTSKELDRSFDLPYTRLPHPKYNKKGEIPAFEMIKFSINMHRGCFGGCSFCTISAHQGKFIASRSTESIVAEAEKVASMPDFKGYISDLGGPSANMYRMQGNDLEQCRKCLRPSCIFPSVCSNLNTDHTPLLDVYEKVSKIDGVKKAFIGSGIRYDILLNGKASEKEKDSHQKYIRRLITHHVSGRLKIAPEHTSDRVLKMMRKPSFSLFKQFSDQFHSINKKEGLNQQLIPYFISSHPASEEIDMAQLAAETNELDFKLEQVQDFTPTPMTVSTVIYYSGVHPYTLKPVFTARTQEEKLQQRMYFFWYKPEYKSKIEKRLLSMHQPELIKKLFSTDRNIHDRPLKTCHSNKKENKNHIKKRTGY
jgi:uncharacterized radical SAM protein YgiQ